MLILHENKFPRMVLILSVRDHSSGSPVQISVPNGHLAHLAGILLRAKKKRHLPHSRPRRQVRAGSSGSRSFP